ncbi:DDE-type integrase/transposase/recombinase [Ralstonia solanacearum]|nr:DDE-type integrase/transposase/recombinase [Ralstonia solanacearum]QJC26273.1 DDE-type integrase/transposase/recombinase [Ralstonia solanacearum]
MMCALDCCNREAMRWGAAIGDYSGDVVHDAMPAAVGQRFGHAPKASADIEWQTDNEAGYLAGKTRAFATDIGLKPLTTPVCSPQNGMAERFVKTMKRDDVAFMLKPDGATAVRSATLLSRASTTTSSLRVDIAVRAWTVLPT